MGAYKFITFLIVFLSIALMDVCALADDWPNWRGPRYNGISDEVDWGGDWSNWEPNILWQQEVGTGCSSISVADGRVYTMGNTAIRATTNTMDKDVIYCLDANTGEILWTHDYLERLIPKNYAGGSSATPTVADGKVYTLSKSGIACCLDAVDGEVLWQKDLVANHGVQRPTWRFAGSAFVDDDLVIYNVGKHGMALYTANGTLAWLTGTGKPGYSTPVPFDWEQRRLLILMGEKTFAAVEARTGRVIWNPIPSWVTGSNVNAADPVVDNNLVFISSGYGKGSALFEEGGSSGTGYYVTQVWPQIKTDMQNKMNSCVLWEGYLYGPSNKDENNNAIKGYLTCVELSTGTKMWSEKGFRNGSVTLADGKLIAMKESGKLIIAEATPSGYNELASAQILPNIDEEPINEELYRCWTVPVLANSKIYVRNTVGNLLCIDMAPPKVPLVANLIGGNCVNFFDFSILGYQWLQTQGYPSANLSPDPRGSWINFKDLVIMLDQWLQCE